MTRLVPSRGPRGRPTPLLFLEPVASPGSCRSSPISTHLCGPIFSPLLVSNVFLSPLIRDLVVTLRAHPDHPESLKSPSQDLYLVTSAKSLLLQKITLLSSRDYYVMTPWGPSVSRAMRSRYFGLEKHFSWPTLTAECLTLNFLHFVPMMRCRHRKCVC